MSAFLKAHRSHPLWLAFALHRLSGLGLVLFLPAHFLMLGLALESGAARDGSAFDRAIAFADQSVVKFAEFGLVFLLAVHAFGGLRLLALEWLPWSDRQKSLAAASVAGAGLVAGVFFLGVV